MSKRPVHRHATTTAPPAGEDAVESGLLEVEVEVEVPRCSFVKRREDRSVDFASPLPSPFNYGAVPGSRAPDGDRLDVVLLGPRQHEGTRVRARVHGVVHFVDAGDADPKLIAGEAPPTRQDLARIHAFFAFYARAKAILNRARGKGGPTRLDTIEVPADPARLAEWLRR